MLVPKLKLSLRNLHPTVAMKVFRAVYFYLFDYIHSGIVFEFLLPIFGKVFDVLKSHMYTTKVRYILIMYSTYNFHQGFNQDVFPD